MSKVVTFGPNSTPVEGLASLTLTMPPLNFLADYKEVDEGPGRVLYTDISSPREQPATLRIAQTSRANVYAGSTIDPMVFLPNKKGTDTIVELRQIVAVTDTEDSTFLEMFPVRIAVTTTYPDTSYLTANALESLLLQVVAAHFEQGAATVDSGLTLLSHGVVKKS